MSLLAQTQHNPFEEGPKTVSGATVDAEKAYLDKMQRDRKLGRIGMGILKGILATGAVFGAGYVGRTLADSEAAASLGDSEAAASVIPHDSPSSSTTVNSDNQNIPLSAEEAQKGLDLILCTNSLEGIGMTIQQATDHCLARLRTTVVYHEEE